MIKFCLKHAAWGEINISLVFLSNNLTRNRDSLNVISCNQYTYNSFEFLRDIRKHWDVLPSLSLSVTFYGYNLSLIKLLIRFAHSRKVREKNC